MIADTVLSYLAGGITKIFMKTFVEICRTTEPGPVCYFGNRVFFISEHLQSPLQPNLPDKLVYSFPVD